MQVQRGRMASDQLRYHEVVVRVLARSWPEVIYKDYLSATTPGYHTAIAALSQITGESRPVFQLIGSVFALVFLGVFAWCMARRAPPLIALALTLPLAFSLYIWPTAVWLLPDSAGWLGVLAILLLSLRTRMRRRDWALAGVALIALVFVRQMHIWTAAVLWTAAWIGTDTPAPETTPNTHTARKGFIGEVRSLFIPVRPRIARAALALGVTLPAFALLGWFISKWGGLTPPHFAEAGVGQVAHGGGNIATPAYVLSVFGALSVFYAGFFFRSLVDLWRRHAPAMALAVIAALLISIAPATTFSQQEGRWTGVIWEVVQRTPTLGGHTSVVIVALAVMGMMSLIAMSSAIPHRARWILIASLVAFTAAQSANHQAWQRYVEPFVLIWFSLAAVRVQRASHPTLARLRWMGPGVLGVGFALLTAISVIRGQDFPVRAYDKRVLPLIESGQDDAARDALDEIRKMFQGPPGS